MEGRSEVLRLYREGSLLGEIAREVYGTQSIARVLTDIRSDPSSGYYPGRRRTRRHRYFYDTRFFSAIDTEAKAYFLGFLAADGWIKFTSEVPSAVCVQIHARDREVLDAFRVSLGQGAPPVRTVPTQLYPCVRLALTSAEMCRDLMAKGFTRHKSHELGRMSQYVPQALHAHFVRGICDGDGGPVDEKYRLRWNIRGTREFLDDLQTILPVTTRVSASGKWPNLYTSRHSEGVALTEWLYRDATIFLKRKKDKCDSALARRRA